MSKVTVVGAGTVGATCANVLAFNEVADEVIDRKSTRLHSSHIQKYRMPSSA